MASALAYAVSFTLGSLPVLFTVGPVMFADGPRDERWFTLGAGALLLFLLGMALGAVLPGYAPGIGFALGAPVLPVTAFFAWSDGLGSDLVALGSASVGSYLVAAGGGSALGARLRIDRARS